MISREEHEDYINTIGEPFTVLCWYCNKAVWYSKNDYYCITKGVHKGASGPRKMKNIYFHVDCFKLIAGDKYAIESY
jgi:hypothetical protein